MTVKELLMYLTFFDPDRTVMIDSNDGIYLDVVAAPRAATICDECRDSECTAKGADRKDRAVVLLTI